MATIRDVARESRVSIATVSRVINNSPLVSEVTRERVRATAERHGGRAYAEGSRFTIELPVLRDVSESSATTTEEQSPKGSP